MEINQWSDEYPKGEGLKGIILAGNAASPSRIFGSKGFGDEAKSEMAISTGSIGGYSIVAGSKAAGTWIRR